jgi:hypothetical protein
MIDHNQYDCGDTYDSNFPADEEPEIDDTVHCCPDCEKPNQFGELCWDCQCERQAEIDAFTR